MSVHRNPRLESTSDINFQIIKTNQKSIYEIWRDKVQLCLNEQYPENQACLEDPFYTNTIHPLFIDDRSPMDATNLMAKKLGLRK